jgi:hypothetical protein
VRAALLPLLVVAVATWASCAPSRPAGEGTAPTATPTAAPTTPPSAIATSETFDAPDAVDAAAAADAPVPVADAPPSTDVGASSAPDAPAAESPRVSIEESGGFAGEHRGIALYADGTVAFDGMCRGGGPATGHVQPAQVRALVAELRRSGVFATFDRMTTTSSQCSDDIIDRLAVADADGFSDSAATGRCDESQAAALLRKLVARVTDVAGRPPCR